MKKILVTVLTLAMLLSMTACGGGSTAESAQPDEKPAVSDTQQESEPPTVPADDKQEQEQVEQEQPAEQEETPVEQEPEPIPEQTTNPEPSVEPTPAPEVTPEQTVTPEPEQEPAPVVKPEPTPEQTVTPAPEATPEVEKEPAVAPEPEQEPDFEIVITPEAIPTPEPTPEVEATGAQTWVEGEKHSNMPKEGDIIITADGVKHTITRDPISGVLGGGLDVRYDIWAGYTDLGNPWTDARGNTDYGYVHGYDNGITGRDQTSLIKDHITGVTHTTSEWAALSKAYYLTSSTKGSYEGEIRNNWFRWEDNGWTWIGPSRG